MKITKNIFKNINIDTFESELLEKINEVNCNLAILFDIEEPNYKNFVIPMTLEMNKVSNLMFNLSHLNSVTTNDIIADLYAKCVNISYEWSSKIYQDEKLYSKYMLIFDNDVELNSYQKRVLEETLLSFKQSGIGLSVSDKKMIIGINKDLLTLTQSFSQNIVNANQEYSIEVGEDIISNFPTNIADLHKKEESNTWVFTLKLSSYSNFLKYCKDSDLRKQIYIAYTTRALENEDIIEQILTLKMQKAKILSYESHADLSLTTKMANSPNSALVFLNELLLDTIDTAKKESIELQDYANDLENRVVEINEWDKSYYINLYRNSVLDFKEEDIMGYLEKEKVQNVLFNTLTDMFDMKFTKVDTYETWDDKVEVFEISRNGELESILYIDLEQRANKRDGAWMNNSSTHFIHNGTKNLPVAYIIGNFTQADKDGIQLLNTNEVITLYHEMGHVLQHICSTVNDPTVSGINGIEWDAVEWSSQFLENLFFEDYTLNELNIPTELSTKLKSKLKFRWANNQMRQLCFGIFDMEIHSKNITNKEDVQVTLDKIRNNLGIKVYDFNKFQCQFSHIFCGGYSAGYYSYKWSEVLSQDCYSIFSNLGINNKENTLNYYNKFLSLGSSERSLDMFNSYCGRKPNPKALIDFYKK